MLRILQSTARRSPVRKSFSVMSVPQWRELSDAQVHTGVAKLNAFLHRTKSRVTAAVNSPSIVHVMIGNEAADADSIISSLVYAFFRDHEQEKNVKNSEPPTVFLPVLSIPRDELALRCDVMALFQSLAIDVSALLFVDEFPWRHAAFQRPSNRLRMTLLDHNALNTKRIAAELSGDEVAHIVEILDHHMDVGSHAHAPHREIAFADGQALVASCCTLVGEKLLATPELDSHVKSLSATLLLAVIALDSVNFDPSAKKVTPRDVATAERLDAHAFTSGGELFKWLQAEKFNVAHWAKFTINNCLQCDYKEFPVPSDSIDLQPYGVSAILIPLDQFVRKAPSADALIASLQAYCDVNQLAFLVVMGMTVRADGSRHREILFYEGGDEQTFTKRCLAFFNENGSLDLAPLTIGSVSGDARVVAFDQRNVGASRKQVVPLIQQALLTPAGQVKL